MALPAQMSEMMKLMEQQKILASTADRRKGHTPTTRPSRLQLEHAFALEQSRSLRPTNGQCRISQTIVGLAYPPCTTPLSQLQAIDISQLRLETHHRGRVLVVRTFGHAQRFQAVQNAIEDHLGNVDRLAAYNVDPNSSAQKILPKGNLFAIKEPYYKLSIDGFPIVRVDHPSDLVCLDPDNPILPKNFRCEQVLARPTVVELKNLGNLAFKQKDWQTAKRHYSTAIDACVAGDESLRKDLLRNRAMANIHLQQFEHAVADAAAAIITSDEASPANAKAHYRAGCASYQLRNFAAARRSFEEARKLSPDDFDTEREYKRTISRIIEQQTGKYDLTAICASVSDRHRRLDHAGYIKRVEVQEAPGRGRGLFAAENIRAGELVFSERAHCVAFEGEETSSMSITMNLNTDTVSCGPHASLLVRLVQDALRNPDRGQQLLDLYDADYQPKSGKIVDGVLAIDVFQAHQILGSNVFGCPAISTAEDLKLNKQTQGEDSRVSSSCGVWLLASRMNHACNPNTHRAFVGDFMVVHATRDIQQGEEIFTAYRRNDGDYAKTQKALQNWGFKCECSICSAEEKTKAQLPARVKLVEEADRLLDECDQWVKEPSNIPVSHLKKGENIYERLAATYDDRVFDGIPRLGLCLLALWLAGAYLTQGKPTKASAWALLLLRDYGYTPKVSGESIQIDRRHCQATPEVFHAAIYAAEAFQRQGKWGISQALRDFAKETYQVVYGIPMDDEKSYVQL